MRIIRDGSISGARRYPRKFIASFLLLLFCMEILIAGIGWHIASAEPGPDNGWDGSISEWFAVKYPDRYHYKWFGCNTSYLMLDIKDSCEGTDYLNFTVDGKIYNATFGHNAWGLDLPEEDWNETTCRRQVHEICFNPGTQKYIDSAWVQPAILASGNATGMLENYVQIPFFGGGDIAILLQPAGSFLDLGVQVTDGPNETEKITLKRADYQDLYPDPIPDIDCATVAGAIEGRLANRFDVHLRYPGNHSLYVRTTGAFDYTVIAGGGVDIDGDELSDVEEAENYGQPGYDPLVPCAWGFRIGEADHPTFWDFLFREEGISAELNLSAYQEKLKGMHFSDGMVLFIPPSWRYQVGGLLLYADVEVGSAENFTVDGAPVFFGNNESTWGFNDIAGSGFELTGVNEFGTPISIPSDGMMSFEQIFLGSIQPGWHTVRWWVDAEAAAFLGTWVNLRINQFTIPILDKTWADMDADNLEDEWEIKFGLNPGNADTDGDGMLDPVDVSKDTSLFLPVATINQIILPVSPNRDARVTFQVHPPALDLTENYSLEWNPLGSTEIGTQVCLIPSLGLYGSGNSEEVDYWANRAELASFWGKTIITHALADVQDIEIAVDANPLPKNAGETGQYYTFILPEDITPNSWQFTLQFPADFPPLVVHHYIDLRFDLVYLLVKQAWQNASDQSILRWYEIEEPLLLQGLSVTEIGDVAWALGSPDNAEETSVIFSSVINPALGNPTNYGLTGITAPNPDVIGWGSGQLLFEQFNANPANLTKLSVADRIAAARKARPRAEDEAEVTFYGCTERTYDALRWLNKSAKVDSNSGQLFCPFPGNNFSTIPDNDPLPAIQGWTVDPETQKRGLAHIRRNMRSRAKVIELAPYSSIPAIATKSATSAASDGIVEFWVSRLAGEASGKLLDIELLNAAGQVVGKLRLNNEALQVFNCSTFTWGTIGEVWDNEWFQIIVDFNCTKGMSDIVVGGVSCDWAPQCGLMSGANNIQKIRFTAQATPFIIDGVQFSWDGSYDPGSPEFFNTLFACDNEHRRAWYTISDVYEGRFESEDPMLIGEDVIAWETYWSDDLHEERRCLINRLPVDINFIRADEANAWTPNPDLDGFKLADCLKVTSVIGDIPPNFRPTTLATLESEQNTIVKRTQGVLAFYYEYIVEPIYEENPPAVQYDAFDDVKVLVDLRERVIDRLSYWFEPQCYSLWKQWLSRIKMIEYYFQQDAQAMDHFIHVLDEYFTQGGAHCANPLEITWQMRVPEKGILFTDRVRDFIENFPGGSYDAYNPPMATGPHSLIALKKIVYQIRQGVPLDQIQGLTYSPEDGTYRFFGKEFEPGKYAITCKLTPPTIRQWALDFITKGQQYFADIKLPVGSIVQSYAYMPTPEFGNAGSMEVIPISTYVDFAEKAAQQKSVYRGKAEIWGPGNNFFLKQTHSGKEVYRRVKGYLLNGVPISGTELEIVDFALACKLNFPYGGIAWLHYSTKVTNAPTVTSGPYQCMVDGKGNIVPTHGSKVFLGLFERLRQLAPQCAKTPNEAADAIRELDAIESVWRQSKFYSGVKNLHVKIRSRYIMTRDQAFALGRWERGANDAILLNLYKYHENFAIRPLACEFIEKLAARMGVDILDKDLSGVVQSAALTQVLFDLIHKKPDEMKDYLRNILITLIRDWVPDGMFQYFQQWTVDVIRQAEQLCPSLSPMIATITSLIQDIFEEGLGKKGINPWIKVMQADLAKEARLNNFIIRGFHKVLRNIVVKNQVPFRFHYIQGNKETVVTFNVDCYGGLIKDLNPAYLRYQSIGLYPDVSLTQEIYVDPLDKKTAYLGNPNWGMVLHKYGFYGPISRDDIRRMNHGLDYCSLYDGYFGPETIPFDPVLMAWMLASRSHGRLTPSNVAHDVAYQWIAVIQQANIAGAHLILSQIAAFATELIENGMIASAMALATAAVTGMLAYVVEAAAPQLVSFLQAGAIVPAIPTFIIQGAEFSELMQLALDQISVKMDFIQLTLAFTLLGVGLQAAIMEVLLGLVLWEFSSILNQLLNSLSKINAELKLHIDLPDQTRRNLIQHGNLETGDCLDVRLSVANTGQTIVMTNPQTGFPSYSGNGCHFTYDTSIGFAGATGIPREWAQNSVFLRCNWVQYYGFMLTGNSSADNATLSFRLPVEEPTNQLKLVWQDYFVPKQGGPTPVETRTDTFSDAGLCVTEPTFKDFLAHCQPTERVMVENKTWNFLMAAWEGRFKDAGDTVDQAIATVGFMPDLFNATFANAIPHYNGSGYMNPWNDPGIPYCPNCDGHFNTSVGYCTQCGWKLDHYGVNISRYDGPNGWHDLVTHFFGDGFRSLLPAPGAPDVTPTVEWQASVEAYHYSNHMLLVPADWIARKNQSMPLVQALLAARGTLSLRSNLDVIPDWNGTLEVPAHGFLETALHVTVDGLDNPLVSLKLGTPPSFGGTLLAAQGTCRLKELPAIRFEIHPANTTVPAGFYTAQLNLTFTNGTPIVQCLIPFYYQQDRSLGLDLCTLPETITPGETVTWGRVANRGTIPEALLVEVDGVPAEWGQGTPTNVSGFYPETIDLRSTTSSKIITRIGFEDGLGGWAGSFASGATTFKSFLPTYNAAFVDMSYNTVWVPPTGPGFVVGPGTYIPARDANFDREQYLVSSSSRWVFLQVPRFGSTHPLASMIPSASTFKLGLTTSGFAPLTPLEMYPCGPFNERTITGNTIPAIDWGAGRIGPKPTVAPADVRVPDLTPGAYMLRGEAYSFWSDEWDATLGSTYTFEKFGARQGKLLFQTDGADSFTARKLITGISLRAGDRVRVAFATSATTLITMRIGTTTFTLVPAGNSARGTQETTFTLPAGMDSPALEIAGTLGAQQYLHVSSITFERPAQVLEYASGRREVLALGADSGGDVTDVEYPINPGENGTAEMWVMGSNWTAPLAIELRGATSSAGITVEHQQVRAWDGAAVCSLANLSATTGWTHVRLDFNMTARVFAVWINNISVARMLPMNVTGIPTPFDTLRLATSPGHHAYFADAIGCSSTSQSYVPGANLMAACVNGSEERFFLAPGTTRDLTITVPHLSRIAPGTYRLCARLLDPITWRLIAVTTQDIRVGEFHDIGLEVRPLNNTAIAGGTCTYAVTATNFGNVPEVITLGCEGDAVGEWAFEVPTQELAPGQSFATLLNISNVTLPPGWHVFNITATTAANLKSLEVDYFLEELKEQAPDSSDGAGGQILDNSDMLTTYGVIRIAGIIVLAGSIMRKRKKPTNVIVARRT